MTKRPKFIAFVLVNLQFTTTASFQTKTSSSFTVPSCLSSRRSYHGPTLLFAAKDMDETELKSKLAEYLKKREESGADDLAKS